MNNNAPMGITMNPMTGSSKSMEKEETGMNPNEGPLEEPDEVPCILPFIPVDVGENMVDPLMDTNEPDDSTSNMCHNGDNFGASDDDDGSSVEFVSEENAINDGVIGVAPSLVDNSLNSRNNGDGVVFSKRHRVSNFSCTECHHSFDTESELELHTETLDVALLCAQCESSFWSPCALNQHKSEHAAAMQQQMSNTPGYDGDFFLSPSYYYYNQLQADKPYTCKHCGAGYSTKFNLMRHVRKNVVWLKNAEPYRCDQCDATFLAKCLLPLHKREKHRRAQENYSEITENSLPDVNSSIEAESLIVTPQFGLLERDIDPLEDESHLSASASTATAASSYHTFRTATATGITYNCKWCPEKFPTHPALIKHIGDEHPDVQLFRCEPCNKTFLNKAGLYGHVTHHRFQCDKCQLSFSSDEFLRQHRLTHGDDPAATSTTPASTPSTSSSTSTAVVKPPPKPAAPRGRYNTNKPKLDGIPYFELLAQIPLMSKPFECQFCGKEFMYKTTYLEHYLTHTGERPFRCAVCNQGFIRERAMEIHQSSHGVGSEQSHQPQEQQRMASPPVSSVTPHLPPPPTVKTETEDGNVRRRVARKSTSSIARPSNRINPNGRAVINGALFDPELDVTPEDQDAFYFLPIVGLKMLDLSALEDHAYVCPYCDKFFPRPSSLCGHKKICSYLTRMRAQKESAAAMGVTLPLDARKLGSRHANWRSALGATATANGTAAVYAKGGCYGRPDETSVVIANMRHHIVFENGERVFVCGVCGKQFARKFTLSEHCRSHTTDRPFNCDRCPRAFKRKSSLFRHRRRNHIKTGPVAGGYGHGATANSFAQHPMADQNWMSFEPQCNVKIEFSDEDEEDDEEDTPGEEEDFKPIVDLTEDGYPCDESNSHYDYSEMSVFEPQCIVKDDVPADDAYCNSNSNCNNVNSNFGVAAADGSGDLVNASMNHFLEVGLTSNGGGGGYDVDEDDDDYGDDAAAEAFADGDLAAELEYERQQELLAAANRFLCGECNRRFPRREDLRRHFAEHASVGPYKCFYCEKTFERRKYLSKHARNHSKKKSYQCSFCERAYVTNAELTIHVRIHTGERPYECDQCGKGFRVQKQLTLHYRTHTGEKPYACTYCPCTFSRHETLFRHNRVCQARQQQLQYQQQQQQPRPSYATLAAAVAAHQSGVVTAPPPLSSSASVSPAAAATPQLSQLLRQPPPRPSSHLQLCQLLQPSTTIMTTQQQQP